MENTKEIEQSNFLRNEVKKFQRLSREFKNHLKTTAPEVILAKIFVKARRFLFRAFCKSLNIKLKSHSQTQIKGLVNQEAIPLEKLKPKYLQKLTVINSGDKGARPRLNIVLPALEEKHMFGGIITATLIGFLFKLKNPQMDLRFITVDLGGKIDITKKIMARFLGHRALDVEFQILDRHEVNSPPVLIHSNDRFMATSWWSCYPARQLAGNNQFLYLVQDYEPGFYGWGDDFIASSATYKMNFVPLFNTKILQEFFAKENIISKSQINDGCSFEPVILAPHKKEWNISSKNKKRFFFYARPNAPRNLYITGLCALSEAIEKGIFNVDEWEFISAGESHNPILLSKNCHLESVGKFNLEEYHKFLATIDIGLSLMLSPHPSYPPLEIALAGGVCVTNSFKNKDLEKQYSNIVSCDPCIEGVVEGLKNAVIKIDQYAKECPKVPRSQDVRDWEEALKHVVEKIGSFIGNSNHQ